MTDETGQYGKLRKSSNFGTWVTIVAMGAGLVAAWATNANRLTNAEQQSQRIDTHLSADDQRISANEQQIAVVKERLQVIIEQLQLMDAKLDRAEEERRK